MGNESKVAFSFFPENGNGSLPLNLAYGYSKHAGKEQEREKQVYSNKMPLCRGERLVCGRSVWDE